MREISRRLHGAAEELEREHALVWRLVEACRPLRAELAAYLRELHESGNETGISPMVIAQFDAAMAAIEEGLA
jgi:hypothetical protein